MKRKKLIILCLLIYIMNLFSSYAYANPSQEKAAWPKGPDVFAEAAIVMEASTGLILYEKDIHSTYYPASITKILTALIAIENTSPGEIVTFSRNAVFGIERGSSHIGIDVGEELTMQQCLYAILLESANEVTYAVAEHIAGSIPAFSEMMNEKARSLGCLNSNFVNPHGLPDDNHYTSAYDMALITREALKNETFRKINSTRTYQIPPTNIQEETRYLRHHHRFILKQDFFYDDCTGGKTGYTNKARYTLTTTAKRGDLELICVILRDDSLAHQYTDTKKLLDFAFDNFSIYPIADLEDLGINESPYFTKYNQILSKSNPIISTDEEGYLVLPNSASFDDAIKEVEFFETTENIDGKDVIGTISYEYKEKYVGSADIILNKIENLRLDNGSSEATGVKGFKQELTPSPSPTGILSKDEEVDGEYRPLILALIVGFLVLIIGLYLVFVERPRLKRRRDYLRRRENHKLFRDDDYMNI